MLLLDEPSLGLAPTIVDIVFETLAAIRERGLAVLLVEQRAQRTVALADRTHVLSNGELRLTLTPDGRGRHRADGRRVLRMTPLADVLGVDWQTLVDAIGLGAVYALMAVGIGLVFGVLRLVNFAYGQLIMAGAYALALASEWDWPGWAGIALCFAVVIALSMRDGARASSGRCATQSPAVMLVATFAVAFLLQSIALLWFGPLGKTASSFASLNRPIDVGGRRRAQDHDRRDRRRGALPRRRWCCCSSAPGSACTCARRRWTSGPRGCSAWARTG